MMFLLTWSLILLAVYIIYKLILWINSFLYVSKLSERYILLTGAGSGFGLAAAKRLDSLGCHVIAGYLSEKGEVELRKSCSERVTCIHMDVSKPESVRKAFDAVMKIIPPGKDLWAVINNAGVLPYIGNPEWMLVENYKSISDVNLYGLIDVTMTFLPLIKKSGGRIVNVSSQAGRFSQYLILPYCVSKFGVEAFNDGLRRSLYDYPIRISIIEPGWFTGLTQMTYRNYVTRYIEKTWQQTSEETKEEFGHEYYNYNFKGSFDLMDTIGCNNIDRITDAYIHAVVGRFPLNRYIVGFDANYIWLPIQFLPEWLGDWLTCKVFGDKNQPMPAALLNRKVK